MSNEIARENALPDEEASPLQGRPERRARRRPLPLLLLLMGFVILVGGVIGLVSLLHAQQPTGSATTASAAKSGRQALPQGCTGARIPRDVVAQHAAGGLQMTVDQVKAQVRAGKTFAQVATARDITAQQLRTLEIQSLQQANNYWLGLGCITSQQVTSNMQRDVGGAAFMDAELTDMFRR